jgi:hypothetical protein
MKFQPASFVTFLLSLPIALFVMHGVHAQDV